MKNLDLSKQERELLLEAIAPRLELCSSDPFYYQKRDRRRKSPLERVQELDIMARGGYLSLNSSQQALLTGILRENLIDPNEARIYHFQASEARTGKSQKSIPEVVRLNAYIKLFNRIVLRRFKYAEIA